jgi:hypothetical protein
LRRAKRLEKAIMKGNIQIVNKHMKGGEKIITN